MTRISSARIGTNVIIGVGLAILAATLAVLLFVPKPTTRGLDAVQRREENLILTEISALREDLEREQEVHGKRLWRRPVQEIGPASMAAITAAAKGHSVKLAGFRPQRTTDAGSIEMLRYLVSAEGTFPNVLGFVRALETPDSKLAVELVQMASTDGSSNMITATVGIAAYRTKGDAPIG